MAPNAIGAALIFDGTTTVNTRYYCQFTDVGDGSLKMTLADGDDCLPSCTIGYMASAWYECGTGSVVVTPVCLPATKITNKLSYDGADRRSGLGGFVHRLANNARRAAGADVGEPEATSGAIYNADDAPGVLVRAFFECGMLQMLMVPDGTIDNAELDKVGQGGGQCVLGTTTGTTAPFSSRSSKLTDDTDATA